MRHVLIVDDDYDICEALQLILEHRYRVSLAYNGAQALEVLEREHVDVVVVDLMMPVMDGEELVRQMQLRQIGVPVVFASAAPHLPARARKANAVAFLQKPFDASQLERTLEQILHGGGGGSPRGGGFSGTPSGFGGRTGGADAQGGVGGLGALGRPAFAM